MHTQCFVDLCICMYTYQASVIYINNHLTLLVFTGILYIHLYILNVFLINVLCMCLYMSMYYVYINICVCANAYYVRMFECLYTL